MKARLQILTVTDDSDFEAGIKHELRRGGLSFCAKRVATAETLRDELKCRRPDVILSNGGTGTLDGRTALAVAQELRSDVPFIFVAGSPGEEPAAKMLPAEAPVNVTNSVVPKLCAAVRRAVREARERAKLRDLELLVLTSRWLSH